MRRRAVVARVLNGQIPQTRQDLQDLLGLPVLLDSSEVPFLQKYGGCADRTIVEIGAAYGGSSLNFLLSKKPGAELFSIDPFVVDSMGPFQATRNLCETYVKKALTDCAVPHRAHEWHLIQKYSYDAVHDWNRTIDVLFIDGDHRFDAVMKDVEDWLPHLAIGGHMLFHDSCRVPNTPDNEYNKGWPGPTQTAETLRTDPRVVFVEQLHSISVFRKKNG
ncbi:MAG: class I SAM-dependent methyltransferase [Minisyncoccota bacterium]